MSNDNTKDDDVDNTNNDNTMSNDNTKDDDVDNTNNDNTTSNDNTKEWMNEFLTTPQNKNRSAIGCQKKVKA